MHVSEFEDGIRIDEIDAFNLANTVLCGQAFRWWVVDDWFHGIVGDRLVVCGWQDETLTVRDYSAKRCGKEELTNWAVSYFCLDTDHLSIEKKLMSIDDYLAEAVSFGPGIRVLAQDPWECLASYILSARNNIPNIMRTIDRLSTDYGQPVSSDEYEAEFGCRRYSFPTPEALAAADLDGIRASGAAFRSRYLLELARAVNSGLVDLKEIEKQDYETARQSLMCNYGVGPKIAECVLLFSLKKYRAFPIDVWISRVMRHVYMNDAFASPDEIKRFAHEYFNGYAGYAQMYLFYWGRVCKGELLRNLDKKSAKESGRA